MINRLKPDFLFEDGRGTLVQLVREGFKQFNVITSSKGVVRGGHYHRENREAFYVIQGRFTLEAREIKNKAKSVEKYVFMSGDMFEIPPLVVHGFSFEEDTILVSMYDRGVELSDGKKDIIAV